METAYSLHSHSQKKKASVQIDQNVHSCNEKFQEVLTDTTDGHVTICGLKTCDEILVQLDQAVLVVLQT